MPKPFGKQLRSTLTNLIDVLKKKYHAERIVLFGSYAYGKPTAESDLDLLIVKKTTKPFYQRLLEVRRLVSSQRRGVPFDPLVVTPDELKDRLELGDQFLQEILDRGLVLYAR